MLNFWASAREQLVNTINHVSGDLVANIFDWYKKFHSESFMSSNDDNWIPSN